MHETDKRTILLGAIVGAFSGAVMAVLYQHWKREQQVRGGKPVNAKQIIRLSAAIAAVLRQFIELTS